MKSWALLFALSFAPGPALAAATPWQELAPGVSARLITSDRLVDGATLAGIEIDMPTTTKTYWRIPGETGIPTEISFAGSEGLGTPEILWPYPQIDRSQGYLDYVYYGPVVLPLRIAMPTASGRLDATITLGICSDVCVPAMASFSLPMSFTNPDSPQSLRLDQAVAETPIDWDQSGPAVANIVAQPDGVAIEGLDPAIDAASVIADLGDPSLIFDTPQKSPDGALWTLRLLGGVGTKGLEGRPIQLTFMTRSGPYSVSRQIGAAP